MKVKELLPLLFNIEDVKIYKAGADAIWSGRAYAIPEEYYNENIDKLCSFPVEYLDSYTYIFLK